MEDKGLTAKEKKDIVTIITNDYEDKKAMDEKKKRLNEQTSNITDTTA